MSIQDDYGVIRENFLVGRCPYNIRDIELIQKSMDVSAILSLQHDECLMRMNIDYAIHERHGQALGLIMARCPMRDFDPEDQRFRLPAAVNLLRDLLQAGHRVYVHCTLGINRAPTVVLAYLTVIEGLTIEDALHLIEQGRPGAYLSWDAYHAYRRDVERQQLSVTL